jgi:hypothetical protein
MKRAFGDIAEAASPPEDIGPTAACVPLMAMRNASIFF